MLGSNQENGPFSSPRVEGNPGDPNWNLNRNPNLGFGPSIQFPDVNDRSSKRLRVDGFYPAAAAAAANLPIEYEDNDRRRLRLVRDHGSPSLHSAANGCQTTNFYHHPPDNITTTFHRQQQQHQHQHQHQGPLTHSYNIHSHLHPHPNYGFSQDYFYMHSKDVPIHHDHDLRTNAPTLNHNSYTRPPFPSLMHHHHQPHHMRFDHGSPHHYTDVRHPNPPSFGSYQLPRYAPTPTPTPTPAPAPPQYAPPPLPPSPPPSLPMDPPLNSSTDHKRLSSPSTIPPSLFPVPVTTSAPLHSLHPPIPDPNPPVTTILPNSHLLHTPHGMFQGDHQGALTSFGQYHGDGHTFSSKNNFPDKPKIINAVHLFKPPHRTSRPDYFVIILRGLPGSGKSYLAKLLRDLEVEHGGNAPRIHSMDDYFMTEVEKIEEGEASKSSARGKKPTRKVLEYCYEPEMEEAYRSSMLKAFKKTLEEGAFTFIIVDDRNLRVADFAQFWATAKRSGYEVYVLEAPYKDPAGCTARNVHGFTQVDIEKMAAQWEDAPSMYLQVDVKCLVQGDELKESNIQEVDMDTEDGDVDGSLLNSEERGAENIVTASAGILELDGSWTDKRNWEAEVCIPTEEVKDLGRSKWSNNFDDEDNGRTEVVKSKAHVLSGLVKTYGRGGKSVHWGDQGIRTGFSIGAVKKANLLSLVIGPGAGYNLKSNPLSEEDAKTGKSRESKKHSIFQERLRAEQESFRAVFDRRRQRIGGLDVQED